MRRMSAQALCRGFVIAVISAFGFAWQSQALRAVDGQGRLDMPFSRVDAEITARHLYLALLNREPGAQELNDAIAELQLGSLRARVNTLVQSQEFQQRTAPLPPAQALEQIHQGLLGRPADGATAASDIAALKTRQYAQVTLRLIGMPEYRQRLIQERKAPPAPRPATEPPTATPAPSPAPAAVPPPASLTGAAACQEQVVEKIRVELPGLVLLRFEPADVAAGVTTGTAVDVLDGNRRLSYRCDRTVNYRYDDSHAGRSAPFEAIFPDTGVQRCHEAVTEKLFNERSTFDAVFESAGVMPTPSGDTIRGVGFETLRTGRAGATFHYQCDMDGDVVRVMRYRIQ